MGRCLEEEWGEKHLEKQSDESGGNSYSLCKQKRGEKHVPGVLKVKKLSNYPKILKNKISRNMLHVTEKDKQSLPSFTLGNTRRK